MAFWAILRPVDEPWRFVEVDDSQPAPGHDPVYASSQVELAKRLNPPRDRKIVQLALKLPNNPGKTSNGRYHVAEWEVFINANFDSDYEPPNSDKLALEMQKLQLQNEKLEFELSVRRRDFSSNKDIEQWVGEMVMAAKRVLLAIPAKCAPQVVGRTEVEAEKILKEEINAALDQLTSRPWNEP